MWTTTWKAGPNLENMLNSICARDILLDKGWPAVVQIDRHQPAFQAVKLMADTDKGAVLISPTEKDPGYGIFTERDYIGKMILQGRSSKDTPVEDVMTRDLITVTSDVSLERVIDLLVTHKFRHLPVYNFRSAGGKIVGMISSRDIVNQFLKLSENATDINYLREETVGEVFEVLGRATSQACWISPEDSVYDALVTMEKYKAGGVFVCDKQKLSGIFTERDYLTKVIVKGRVSKNTQVKDVMSTDVKFVSPKSSVHECLDLMAKNKFRTLPVLSLIGEHIDDDVRQPIGLITDMGLIKFLAKLKNKKLHSK